MEREPILLRQRPSSSNVAKVRRENLLLKTPIPLCCIGLGSVQKYILRV